ncbi:MAG: hypothetical protein KF860_10870 [Cyclobacteriaceae bacterium]|nr:hypothetical protein [Cyclobacteriaceae bacterium]
MKLFFEKVKHHRYGLLLLITLLVVGISFFTRLFLFISSDGIHELSIPTILGVFFMGFFFDLINATYFIIPVLLYLWLCPERIFNKRWHRYVLNFILFFFTFLLIFNSFSEWFFWEEFTTRFNFIAVDYLVYTTEVIGNIRQSYPIEWYIAGALGCSVFIAYRFRSWTTH